MEDRSISFGKVPFPLKPKAPAASLVFLVVLLILVGMLSQCVTYIHPYQFGIKEVKIGATRGIQPEIYTPGWAFTIPFGVSRIHLFPKNLQVYDLTHSSQETAGLDYGARGPAANIQTSDGFFVTVDVSILYRIVDPYKVITTLGTGAMYVEGGIIPKAEPVLKQALGTLTTEEFYNSPLRTERVNAARDLLNKDLAPKGLLVEQVLVRYFEYSPEIQKNIEEKKLKDQLVFKHQAEKRAAEEEAKLKRIIEQGEAEITVKLQEGKAYVTGRSAEQELYVRRQRAEGDLKIKLAEAHRTELKNTALQGLGSSRMVGLRMAEALDGLELIVLPSDGPAGFNPLNLSRMMDFFDVGKEGNK